MAQFDNAVFSSQGLWCTYKTYFVSTGSLSSFKAKPPSALPFCLLYFVRANLIRQARPLRANSFCVFACGVAELVIACSHCENLFLFPNRVFVFWTLGSSQLEHVSSKILQSTPRTRTYGASSHASEGNPRDESAPPASLNSTS